MFKLIKSQSGAAAVVELVLVGAVVVFAGLGVWRYYQETNHTPSASTSGTKTATNVVNGSTTPNGTVDDAVNALTGESNAEAEDSSAESTNLESLDSTGADASNVAGAYNENSF